MSLFRRRRRPDLTELDRRAELPGTNPDQFQREFSGWLERHPELCEVSRSEQLTHWLRATD
jgi:hypothetical protein